MEKILETLLNPLSTFWLCAVVVACIAVLVWAADWLVREAVVLSERSGMPKVVIGATVVSLGTTAPEVAVSVMAAINGNPGLAMGNAVGSIICDTGLVLGVACLICPLRLPRKIVNRQGWWQLGCGLLLVLASWPWSDPASVFRGGGGNFPQFAGFFFLFLLAAYLYFSYRWAKDSPSDGGLEEFEADIDAPLWVILVKLFAAVALVIVASHVLVHAISIIAKDMGVPPEIIAGTVIAFGTSLPELVTCITAARRGHGDLAVGNVIGADVLNALFVAGAAAAVTSGGLEVTPKIFLSQFPFMLGILLVFRIGIFLSGDYLKRGFGYLLLTLYAVYLITACVVGFA